MALHAADYERLNACLLRLYRELDAERQERVMLEVIRELVPAESVVLNRFDVRSSTLELVTLPADLTTDEGTQLVAGYLNESPFAAYYVATRDAQWKMTTDFMPLEDFQATALYRQALRHWDINQQMCGLLALEASTLHAVTINRAQQAFTERERLLLNTLHPHLVTSYLNAQAVARAQRSMAELRGVVEAAPGAYGCLQADGRVAWLQERARSWLAEFFADEVACADDLPVSVRALVAQLGQSPGLPQHVERRTAAERLTVCLTASALGGWILRLDRQQLAPQLDLRPLPGLTARAQEVLRWMVAGKRNSEIAAILGISPRTVEKHVEAVLRVLQAENRATAIVRALEQAARPPAFSEVQTRADGAG